MKDKLRSRDQHETFAGICIQQTYSALWWFEQIFKEHNIKSVLELGSGHGALSIFFALHCPENVTTCDIVNINSFDEHIQNLWDKLKIKFIQIDVQDILNAKKLITEVTHPCLVFCDNGNKEKEFEMYSALLNTNDIVAVHDNKIEFFADSDKNTKIANDNNLTRWKQKELDEDGTLLAVWLKGQDLND